MENNFFSKKNQPLISFLLHDCTKEKLEKNIELIFNQKEIEDFEVIICNDATDDGSWEIASCKSIIYDGKISISRNNIPLGAKNNRAKGRLMCKGRYTIELASGKLYEEKTITKEIPSMERNTFIDNELIYKTKGVNHFQALRYLDQDSTAVESIKFPLVTIYIYNFNYGRYLRQCFESALSQTYQNIEICFSDNASTDDSWKIAMEYAKNHPRKISLTRNRNNLGPSMNLWSCELNRRGKYVLKLCSDDALNPEFVTRCVNVLEKNPSAAFAMTHREIVDEQGNVTQEPSFYDHTCLIPGASQAAVFMMAMVNPSVSQILYNAERMDTKSLAGHLNDRWHREHLVDFHLCTEFDVIYIKDPLIINRVHSMSDGSAISSNLLQCFTQYVLVHQFADIASINPHMDSTVKRLPSAIEKIGILCLRYAIRFILLSDDECAKRYFHLAQAIYPKIIADDNFKELDKYWSANADKRKEMISSVFSQSNLTKRVVSYPPPADCTPLYN